MNKYLIIIMAALTLNASHLHARGDKFTGELSKLTAFLQNTDPEKAYYNTDINDTPITADTIMHLGTPASAEVKEVVKQWEHTNPELANTLLQTPAPAQCNALRAKQQQLLAKHNVTNISNSNYVFTVPSNGKKYQFKVSGPVNRTVNQIVMAGFLTQLNEGKLTQQMVNAAPTQKTYQTVSRKTYDIGFETVAQLYDINGLTKPTTHLVQIDTNAAPYKGSDVCDENTVIVQDYVEKSPTANVYATLTPEQIEELVIMTLGAGLWSYNEGNVLHNGSVNNVDMEQINRTNSNELFRASAFREIHNGANGIEELEAILNKAETAAQYKELQKCMTVVLNSDTAFGKTFKANFGERPYSKRLNLAK